MTGIEMNSAKDGEERTSQGTWEGKKNRTYDRYRKGQRTDKDEHGMGLSRRDTAGTGRNSAKHPQSENFSTNSGKETANELLLGLQRPVNRTGTPEGKQTLF